MQLAGLKLDSPFLAAPMAALAGGPAGTPTPDRLSRVPAATPEPTRRVERVLLPPPDAERNVCDAPPVQRRFAE